MQKKIGLALLGMLCIACLQAQNRRFDTTMKLGKTGYRVNSTNRNPDKNMVTISPIGFENTARDVSIEVKGRIRKSEVDDLNADGFPDLLLYVFPEDAKNKGSVIAISSDKNQGYAPIFFPDIVDDPKIRTGYMGNDQFALMEGTLVRRFPVYATADTTDLKPTGTMRQVMYRVQRDEKGTLRFRVTRTYDFNKP
ncbi:hypothetical protein [Sediminibacterium soli]|uniref:hypothetical protein n=1 Tax=Sediminibacterium soli TaxID=2698829 RepID=UPI00137B678C|nr:hypothetical protein [Sediminibacterium soli]NCI47626.1 hypothetical protein [Sediminibacterium soli]